MKGNTHSLYQEALYARVSDKLSYDIIGQVSLIDRVKCAALRYIRNEELIAETTHVNKLIASSAKEYVSKPDPSPCDNDPIIIPGRCSGFEPNTDLITQNSLEIVTAALQMQGGG